MSRRPGPRCRGSLATHVSMQDLGGDASGPQTPGEFLCDSGAAVLAAGTTEGNGGKPLAFLQIAGRDDVEQLVEVLEKGFSASLTQDIVANWFAQTGLWSQLGNPVWVRQEPDVEHHVCIDWYAVLEAEGDQGDPEPILGLAAVRMGDPRAELMDIERRRVDYQIGGGAQGGQRLPFPGDAVKEPSISLQRMRSPYRLLSPDDHIVGRLEVQDLRQRTGSGKIAEHRWQLFEELPGANVQDHCQSGKADFTRLRANLRQHAGRQVVDDVPAKILQGVGSGRPAGSRHAGDHHQPELASRRLVHASHYRGAIPLTLAVAPVACPSRSNQLRASGIARRRAEEERADPLFGLRVTTT